MKYIFGFVYLLDIFAHRGISQPCIHKGHKSFKVLHLLYEVDAALPTASTCDHLSYTAAAASTYEP